MVDDHSAPVDEENLDPFSREPEDLLGEEEEGETSGISLSVETEENEDDEGFFINQILETQYGEELPY